MRHAIFVCTIFLAIIATTFSSDVELESDQDVQTTARITTISQDLEFLHKEPEPDAKLREETDLVTVVPTIDDLDESKLSSPKSKRCKLSTRSEIVSKNNRETILRSKSSGNFRNSKRRVGNSLSSKRPAENTNAVRRVKDVSFHDNDLFKLLRLYLIQKYSNAGGPAETLMPSVRVMENDNFVCYCLPKKPRSAKHTCQNTDSHPQLSMRRYNVAKNNQNRNPIVSSRQFENPRTIPNDFYSHVPQYLPNYYTNNLHSALLPGSQHAIPYIPYIYGADRRLPKLSAAYPGKSPSPQTSIPLDSFHRIPDSIVGAPTVRKESCKKGRPPKERPTVVPNEIIAAETTPGQSYSNSTKEKSITDFANEVANKLKTTGRKILDYLDMKSVKSHFTPKPFSDETVRSPSDFDEPGDNGRDNINQPSRLNLRKDDSMSPGQTECDINDAADGSNLYVNPRKFTNAGPIVGNARDGKGNRPFKGISLAKETTKPMKPYESIPTAEFDDEDPQLGRPYSAEDDAIESPNTADNYSLLDSYEFDPSEQGVDSQEQEERTINEDFVNTNTESAGAKQRTTIEMEDENDPSVVGSTRNSFVTQDTVGGSNPSDESMPFCDNTLLQKSIKAVINNFAVGDPVVDEETVASPMGEDLLPEIVKVPNLKGVLSVPPIELTILDKVKNLLSSMTGVQRENFDNDWPTNVIRNTLHHTFSAAPKDDADLPPITYEERQFRDGQWMTGMATLQPATIKEWRDMSDAERLRVSLRNILRDPNIDTNTARNPVVQNMIVQCIQNFLKPENTPGKKCFDRYVIRSTLNNELSNMETENARAATAEYGQETGVFDASSSNTAALLNFAKTGAGVSNKNKGTTQSLNYDSVKASRDHAYSGTSRSPMKLGIQKMRLTTGKYTPLVTGSPKIGAAVARDQLETLPDEIADYEYTEHIHSATDPVGSTRTTSADKIESAGELVRMENVDLKRKPYAYDTFGNDDYAYLGRISIKNKENADNLQNLRNSELFYIGDGVQLPLEVRKLRDGTYVLSISRKICEHLLNKECPCCVPENGKIVRTVKNHSGTRNSDRGMKAKRIFKRETPESILPNERRERDLADDNLKVLSMPVESFAKRYNLSLGLGKVQTPSNLEEGNISGPSREQQTGDQNKEENNSGADLLYNAPVHPIWKNIKRRTPVTKKAMTYNNDGETNYKYQEQKQRNLETLRYQRNIDKPTTTRSAIAKNILNLIRDIILNIRDAR